MNNPYLGIFSVAANAAKDFKDEDAAKTIQTEMEALQQYIAKQDNAAVKTNADDKAEKTTGISIQNTTGVSFSIGG